MSSTPESQHQTVLTVSSTVVDGKSRRVIQVSGAPEIFFEFDRLMPWPNGEPYDGYVFFILLYAMRQGKPLRVHGTLTQSGVRNIEEMQQVWIRWRPGYYKLIEIIPDSIISSNPDENRGAIAAFSGGVDAMFTALRHAQSKDSVRYPVSTVLMVLGFDVYYENVYALEKIKHRVRPLLEELNLDLRVVRTNSVALQFQNWMDSCILQLGGCLHLFSGEFQYGLIGSSEPYDALVLPIGTSPVTDHLLSGDRLSVIHDGAGFSRTEKMGLIQQSRTASTALKVCWQGSEQWSNCGVCEKCTRTRLNFLAAGYLGTPPCFTGELDLDSIPHMHVVDPAQIAELTSIVAYAEARNITGPWVPLVKERIAQGVSKWPPSRTK